MDVVMPGVKGFQATRTLARDPATQGIPVVIITSKSQETDRIWGLRQGAVDFLVKPVSAAALVAKVQEVLAQAAE
jgi:twitching motility two-component system response regulator PilH